MKTLNDQLSQYAAYHRDRRNIITHFVGIPMIVVAVAILLARPSFDWAGWTWSAATLVVAASVLYYLRLDLRFGVVMGVLFGATLWAATLVAQLPFSTWLAAGVGLFVAGWVIQFVGHIFEGRKPAFVDDIMGLVVGPLFVVAEAAFLLGLRSEVRDEVEARSGPVRAGPAMTPQA